MSGMTLETIQSAPFNPLHFTIFLVILSMKELISEYLNEAYYLSAVDNAAYLTSDDSPIGFSEIEDILTRGFMLDEDMAHAIVFNWLLYGGIKLVKKNWNKTYITRDLSLYSYETTVSDDKVFEYTLVKHD